MQTSGKVEKQFIFKIDLNLVLNHCNLKKNIKQSKENKEKPNKALGSIREAKNRLVRF